MKTMTALFVALFSLSSFACSCANWGNGKEMLKETSAVFLGYPTADSVLTGAEGDMGNEVKTTFAVLKNFKSTRALKSLNIFSSADTGANCGASFKKHTGLFLVFAYKTPAGKLTTASCDLSSADSTDAIRVMSEMMQ